MNSFHNTIKYRIRCVVNRYCEVDHFIIFVDNHKTSSKLKQCVYAEFHFIFANSMLDGQSLRKQA